MDNFSDGIKNYINGDENFALFINGDWGIGKTYFIKNNFLFEIEDDNKIKKEYLSVYDKHSLKEIKNIIITTIFKNIDAKSLKITNGLKNIVSNLDIPYVKSENIVSSINDYLDQSSLDKIQEELTQNNEKTVIIIDDIERLKDDVNIKEFLGFIRNTLLDSFSCKVILIGNDEEMKDERKKDWDYYREKVISRTLEFPNNLDIGIEMLEPVIINPDQDTEDDKENLKKLINTSLENKEKILNAKKYKLSTLNLRTLNLVLTDYKNIYDTLSDKEKNQKRTRLSLFISLFILHNEYRNSNINKSELQQLNLANIISFSNSETNEARSIEEFIFILYFKDNYLVKTYSSFSKELKRYILYGLFDKDNYQRDLNNSFSNEDPEKDTLNILRNFFLYDENTLCQNQKNAVTLITKNEKSFEYRLNLYVNLLLLETKNLYFTNSHDLNSLEDCLLDTFTLQKSESSEGGDLLDLFNYSFIENQQFQKLKKQLSSKLKNKQKECLENQGVYKEFVTSILNENRKKIHELQMIYKEISSVDLYKIFNYYIKYIEEDISNNNNKIVYLNRYLYHNGASFIIEKTNIQKFKDHIIDISNKTHDKVASYNFKILLETLENIIRNSEFKE
ncbi:P-loop NTPase fold protein [Staphylococcus sp. GDX8P66P]|nr:P-loop NTPase fold protein [Staphylococcus sp. GDX8P66P]